MSTKEPAEVRESSSKGVFTKVTERISGDLEQGIPCSQTPYGYRLFRDQLLAAVGVYMDVGKTPDNTSGSDKWGGKRVSGSNLG